MRGLCLVAVATSDAFTSLAAQVAALLTAHLR